MQQRERGGFAGAGRADQRDHFAGLRGEGEIGDGGPLAVIGERDVVEFDPPGQAAGIDRMRDVAHGGHGIEHVEEFLQPRRLHEHAVDEADDLFEPADQHGGEAHEHHDLADGGEALEEQPGADDEDRQQRDAWSRRASARSAIAHHDSTGICAPSSRSTTMRRPITSASMRAKLCTSATLPSASDARSARSE